MRSVHDNNIYSIDIRCDQGIITLHTEFTEDDPPEYTDVLFTGTIAHQFDNIFSGNIILGIDEYRPLDFYEDFKSELESQSRYGLPIPVESASLFISEIEKKSLKSFIVSRTKTKIYPNALKLLRLVILSKLRNLKMVLLQLKKKLKGLT